MVLELLRVAGMIPESVGNDKRMNYFSIVIKTGYDLIRLYLFKADSDKNSTRK